MAERESDAPRLVVTGPAEFRGMVFPLTRHDTVIGHSESANLVLDDRFVSRRHALITIGESGTAVIHDLNSTAGTLVNGEPVTEPRALQPGDIVSFADLTAKFETADSAPASAADSQLATQQLPRPRIAAAAPAPPVRIVMPGPPSGQPAPGPALTDLASVLGPDAAPLITTLDARGITTLAQVRHAGSLAKVSTPEQAATVALISEHADLARLSSNVAANAAIIAAGYTSTLAIARAPQATFITAAAPALGEPGAITMHAQAVAMYNALDDVLTGARLDSATAAGTRYSATVNAAVEPDALQSCCCDDCQSALSPTAYLADLLNYVTTHLLANGQQIGLPYLEETFYQPFGDLPTDCAAMKALVRQARICCEVLRGDLGANPPAAAQASALALAEKLYVLAAYQALLAGLGTSSDEVRLATVASQATRSALAGRLGLTIDPYGAGRPDVLDRLVLGPATAVPPPPPAQLLTEANIERLSGLADTTRNSLSDGPVIGDSNGIIGRWNLDGVSWGRNTDADGTIYLWLAQPGVGELDLALYKDKGLTELVAFGQLSPAGMELPASITVAPENNSGLSGALEVTHATETETISFGAIPLLTSWQLATLRADWQTEDHPADPYTAGTSTVSLAQLPAGVTIPAAVPVVSYNSAAQVLTSTAVLLPADLADLLQAAQGNAAAASYISAVNALYVASQRPPVIDPDVLGPDDFRVPVPGAAAANQPFSLWVTRRQWVDAQLAALQTAQGTGSAPSFTGMLGWMQNDLTYGAVTAKPWAPTTTVGSLEALWENLAQGVNAPAITLQLESDLCLQPQEFNALMDLWHDDQAASAEPPGPPLSSADWRDAVSLLAQAAKTRFFAAWRAEENGLPLDFGSDTFIVSLREPQPGNWPPVLPPGAPLIDPATVPLTGLPEPTAGGEAVQLWTARQAIEATLTSKIRSANETGGFQAMLQQALGDPNAGDPLPVDIDTLAQQLTSTDPVEVAAATTAITTQLFMTAGQFQTLMKLRTMDADPNPAGKPAPAQWAALYAILTTAETAKREYPQWVLAEHNSALTYWMALKARLPTWRASADQRRQWHAALAQRIRLPIIDPDVISPGDMINPVTGDPAFDLWNERTATVAGLITIPGTFPATTASLDALLVPAIGLKSQDLTDLAAQAAQGTDITARLAQLTLTYAAFTQLTTVIGLVAGGIVPLEPDQSACYAILADAQKQRLYAQWNQAEAAAGIIAGPDEFASPAAGATLPPQPPWLAPAGARQAWESTLQSRIEQQGTTRSVSTANADAAEGATITSLRDALVRATGAPGATLQAQGDWLTEHLQIDAETGGSVKTTRIEQAIETLQGLMTAVQSGLGGLELTLSSAPAVTSALGGGRYDIFAVGPGQALWHKYWDGSWHDWENLGGILTSAPAVTSQLPGGLDVFARGADNALWHLAYGDGAWGSWASLGGLLHQGPAAGTPEIDSVDVFVVGPDNQLWQLSESDGTWGNWRQAARTTPLPANGIISAPSVTGSNGSYDVFAEGADLALWHASYDGAAWSGWTSLGGNLSSAPSATGSNGPLQVFARFTDDTTRSLTAQPNGSWQGSQWTSLAGYAAQGPGALAENNVFTVGGNGFLYHKWQDASGWHGWDTTTPISLDAPYFDGEWTWMGSYATWRAATMCRAYPENILDPALRPQQAQTPGFRTLIASVQGTASMTAAQASQFAATYNQYFRDVCSLEVTLSCLAPSVPPGSPQYLFGLAANSGTAYWSSDDPAALAGYQQSFWSTVPGLADQQLSSLAAATSLIVTDTLWVLLVVVQDTSDGPVLEVLRYNTTIDPTTGTGSWDPDGPYTLTLQPGWTSVTAGLGYQGNPQHQAQLGENTALYPPYLVVTVGGSQYERQLSADGTQWAAGSEFVLVGQWTPWTQAAQAEVASGQQIAAVSPAAGQIDLFWVDYSESGGTNTVTTAAANLSVNGGALGNATPVDSSFNTWALTSIPVGQRGNYQTPLTVAARGASHLDIIALGFSGVNWPTYTPDGHHGRNDVYWSWQDADVDGGQWQPFQRISTGTPGDGYPLLNNGHYVIDQVAAIGSGDTLSVLVLTDDGGLYVNWNEGLPEPGGWQETWANVAAPSGVGRTVTFQVLTALCSDPAYIDVQATDSTGVVWGWRWPVGTQPPAVNLVDWFTVNYGGQDSAGTCGAVVAEAAEIYDFCYLGEVPASATLAPLLVSRIDQTGAVRQQATASLGGGLYYVPPDPAHELLQYSAPVAALQRGQSRVEVYVAGPGSPGSAIWTRWTDDPATAGSWSPWAAIRSDGGDISTLAPRWSVSAASQQPLRTDLFVALYGGATGSQGGIYTTYWQDVDFQAAPLDLPPFAVPAGSPPLDIPAQESSTELQQRAQDIRSAFAANQGAPASTMAYLQEAYYFVPVYLANQLVQQGQYQAALGWYRTVYDYTVPEQIRDIYYGLALDENLPAAALTLPAGWLLDPLNPHAIAATRRDAYTRYTVLQIVQCVFAWADSLFTADTSESDAQARALYLNGLALLDLDIFGLQGPCDDLLIQISEIPVDPDWQPLLAALSDDLATIRSRPALASLVPQLTGALNAGGAWPAKFATARGLVATARRDQPAQPSIGGVLSSGASLAAAAYSALLSVPPVDAAATGVSAATAADPRLAAGPVIPHQAPPPEPPGWIHIPVVGFWFCLPANPVVSALLAHGQNCLYELRNGLNIAGQPRQLAPYSAPTNAGSGLPVVSAGGQLQTAAAVTYLPTAYPYATLIANAKQLVQAAQGIEGQMLAALQQRDQDLYEQLQASQNLAVASATVQLQTLAVQQVTASVTLARLQQQTAQLQAGYWQQLLGSDIGGLEQSAITAMQTQKSFLAGAAAATAQQSFVQAIASLGADAAGATASALQAVAGVSAAAAQIDNAQASLELQQDTWQYQYQAATAGVQTAGQQITISTDQLQVASQQLVINQLQASNATDTVNFLANKFTSAPLYDWMAGVLQGVYSFFLQQATVVARQAENQLAFQRQQPPTGYIRSSYWQPASANLLAAGTLANTMGLTGAEQLSADITRLDQYAISTDQRQLQLTATLSLAQLYPVDFQLLRETGVINFSTSLAQFDQDYPGHYLRMIQQVSTSVIALIPPGQNINATLSSTGVSQVVIGPEPFQTVTVRTDPQSVAITTPVGATGVLTQDLQAGLLLPFQYLGVAAAWQFEMPLAGNQFDFSTLADVQITISYTAMSDPGYRAQVIQSLDGQVSQERPYSFVNDLPDQWYDLNNPDQTPTPMSVQFDIVADDFPANLNNIEIQQVVLYFAIAPGQTFEVSVSSLQFFESGSPAAVGGASTTIGGITSTRRGNAPAWIPMIGRSPFGTWQLTLPDTAQVRGWFTGGLITDILFDITYTADTPTWPAT